MAFTPQEQRRLLELSFEPHSDGFAYYRNRWSQGRPVSAAEREAYLSIPTFGSRRAFHAMVAARPPITPSRAYGPVFRQMMVRVPWPFLVAPFGMALLLGRGAATPGPTLQRTAYFAIALAFLAGGAAGIIGKLSAGNDARTRP